MLNQHFETNYELKNTLWIIKYWLCSFDFWKRFKSNIWGSSVSYSFQKSRFDLDDKSYTYCPQAQSIEHKNEWEHFYLTQLIGFVQIVICNHWWWAGDEIRLSRLVCIKIFQPIVEHFFFSFLIVVHIFFTS